MTLKPEDREFLIEKLKEMLVADYYNQQKEVPHVTGTMEKESTG